MILKCNIGNLQNGFPKLRDPKTDNNILIFKTDMKSGHGGASGRFEALKEDALEYAFLLKLENKKKKKWEKLSEIDLGKM